MTKRTTVILLAALLTILAGGAAMAAKVACTEGTPCLGSARADRLTGTPGNDLIKGLHGSDFLLGDTGADRLIGGPGDDEIWAGDFDGSQIGEAGIDIVRGGPGDDRILSTDGVRDIVDCGGGVDTVFFDPELDEVAANCERPRPTLPR